MFGNLINCQNANLMIMYCFDEQNLFKSTKEITENQYIVVKS